MSNKTTSMPRATELEYLTWIKTHGDLGPDDGGAQEDLMADRFMKETRKNIPEGWNFYSDGETTTDK